MIAKLLREAYEKQIEKEGQRRERGGSPRVRRINKKVGEDGEDWGEKRCSGE